MKLLRIWFYQATYFFGRHRFIAPAANFVSVSNYLSKYLTTWSIIILFFVHAVIGINSSIFLQQMLIEGFALWIAIEVLISRGFKRHQKYVQILEDNSYDTRANRIFFYIFHFGSPFLIAAAFLGIIFGIIVPQADLDKEKRRKVDELIIRVENTFEYEGTERDSIAAAGVIGTVDTILQMKAKRVDECAVRLLKFGVVTRARRFDLARDLVRETNFADGLYTPGCDDYLNLRIDFFENKARGNDSALVATALRLCDYLRKRVAAPDFEMDSVLQNGESDRTFLMRNSQLWMLKSLTVHFKEPADSARLVDWLRHQYPETKRQFRLTGMPDKAQAEIIVFSLLPYRRLILKRGA